MHVMNPTTAKWLSPCWFDVSKHAILGKTDFQYATFDDGKAALSCLVWCLLNSPLAGWCAWWERHLLIVDKATILTSYLELQAMSVIYCNSMTFCIRCCRVELHYKQFHEVCHDTDDDSTCKQCSKHVGVHHCTESARFQHDSVHVLHSLSILNCFINYWFTWGWFTWQKHYRNVGMLW